MRPQDVISTYETVGTTWAQHRDKSLMEKAWLDRMLDAAPRTDDKLKILDLGGGSGQPIGTYLAEAGADLTAIEPTKTLSALYAQALPQARVIQTDMRQLDLGERFDCILAWNSFFHLTALDQREMFSTFATHAGPDATLMFTAGPSEGEVTGHVAETPVYHASLGSEDYTRLLQNHGFHVLNYVPADPACGNHTVWLAKYHSD